MTDFTRRDLFLAAAAITAPLAANAGDLLDFSALEVSSPPKPAPDAKFLRADGTEDALANYRGKGVVLNFWATWCPPCVAELPSLDRLAAALAGSNIQVLALSEDTGAKAATVVQNYYAAHGIKQLPVLIDRYGRATDAFNDPPVPTTLLIDARGDIRAKFEGGTNWSAAVAEAKIRAMIG